MNKAFVREPDETGDRKCPRCGSLGVRVEAATLDAWLGPHLRSDVADSAFFCPFGQCNVAYFDEFDRVVLVERLPRIPFPKDASAPVCACFGLTAAQIEEDAAAGRVARVKEVVQNAKSDLAHCMTASAAGRPCTADVQRLFMKSRQDA